MNSKEFKEKIISVTPNVPEHFHLRLEKTLEAITSGDTHPETVTKGAIQSVRRISRRTLTIAIILTLILCAAALAAIHWNLFDNIPFMTGSSTPQNADTVMQSIKQSLTVNNVEITVLEAGYDGRTLLVEYSQRLMDTDKAFGDTITEETMQMLQEHQVGWWIDCFWIDGRAIEMPNNSGGIITGSTVPGEILHTEYWRLDNIGVSLDGTVEISLPIGESQSLEYRNSLYDTRTQNYRLPEKGVVTFTYNAKNISSQIKNFHSETETVLPHVTAKVKEAAFTPLMTYITLDLQVNPDALNAYIAENGEGMKDEKGNLLYRYSGMDVFGDWISALELVDGQGTPIFPDFDGINGYSDTAAEFLYPYLDPLPAELYLAPVEGGTADMRRAIPVFSEDRALFLPDFSVEIKNADFSSQATVITLAYEVKSNALAEFTTAHGENYEDESGNSLYPYSVLDVFEPWFSSLALVDENGSPVFSSPYGEKTCGFENAECRYPVLKNIPSTLYLAPMINGAADMRQALSVLKKNP